MKNSDNSIPLSKAAQNNLIAYSFPQNKPIYWGPGQVTVFPDNYNEPVGWKPNQILTIPQVVRVMFGDGGTAGKGGPCPPLVPPPPPVYTLVYKRDHLEPYPHDYVLVWGSSLGGGGATYSINRFVAGPGGVFLDMAEKFTIGMTVLVFPNSLPMEYSFDQSRYFNRDTGITVVPTFPP